ncbi:MAG TPA: assimilatory sulfite reductase (NADPH) hemoprotein subunit [Kofleriaceae bacterium]|nr:assimilatory sulfite reductase (NADPH) hemoprotein subunit [Kofleriaceae bacterium]
MPDDRPPSAVEKLKAASRGLRGTIAESLALPLTGGLAADDTSLLKFHGSYQQDDRDLREERRQQKLEPDYSFMIRTRLPGGVCTPAQWLALDDLAGRHGNGTLRLTTRQAFQLHGVLKGDLRPAIAAIHAALLDTIAACGDVNRNVVCNPDPQVTALHAQVFPWAVAVSEHLLPRTRAYHEIWLGEERVAGGEPEPEPEPEPIYGRTYLPRKFKTAFAVPPSNDVDVFAHDLGFIAIADGDRLVAFDVAVGGGMGATHGDATTYPRLASVIGSCAPEQVLAVAEQVVAIQRDHGDRSDRSHARLKYTIDRLGLGWFTDELTRRLGWALAPARPFTFDHDGDRFGWARGADGRWRVTLHLDSGRVADVDGGPRLRTGLRALATRLRGDLRLTPNQNLIVTGIDDAERPELEALLAAHGLDGFRTRRSARLHALACVALPTCGLAMAEAERALPSFADRVDDLLAAHGLADQRLHLRITGCPNGCARPYVAEVALVGKGPGRYNLLLGGDHAGSRLARLVRENVDEAEILATLDRLLGAYARERVGGEAFGDYITRVATT